MKGNNVTYTGKTWRKKTYWEDLDTEPPESPTFIHLPARQYTSEYSHGNPSYLPYNFHYYGMDKVKGGKGYKKDGTPIGIIGSPCTECEGTIINVQMNTSSRGMETTCEKVCNTCGLVHDGPFLVLGKIEKEYHTKPYDTHEEWIEQMKKLEEMQGNPDDISLETEMFEHMTGHRPGDDTEIEIGPSGFKEFGVTNPDEKLARQLGLKTKNAANYGRPDKKEWRQKQYYDYIDICKSELHMNWGQSAEVRYLIDTYGLNYFHRQESYEDIIYHICLVVMSDSIPYQRMGGMLKKLQSTGRYNKTLYTVVAAKVNG